MPSLPIRECHSMSTQSAELNAPQQATTRPSELIYRLENRPHSLKLCLLHANIYWLCLLQ